MSQFDEEPDEFHADDFGNDDVAPNAALAPQLFIDFDEEPDDFHADDFGNDPLPRPAAPTGLAATVR